MTTQAPPRTSSRPDLIAAGTALGLFAAASVVGAILYVAGHPVRASAAPLYAHWLPHVGPGTPLALVTAALVLWHGPRLAAELPWWRLLASAYTAAMAWILSLGLVDGWRRGIAGRLTTKHEYLHEVSGVTDIPLMLRTFATRILDFQSDSWTTHVSAHPPGALLLFVGLDRAGLRGGGWAAVVCILCGAMVAVAVPQTLRLLGDEDAARACVPFLVLFPGAVWIGVSADGLFAGFAAVGVALVTHGLTRASPVSAFAGGVVLTLSAYLSYGLVLIATVVLTVAVLARRVPPLGWSLAGGAVVVAAFTLAGFWWLDGYHLLVGRYYQGVASDRAYAYWVWANLGLLAVSAGPAAAAILRRAAVSAGSATAASARRAGSRWPLAPAWLLPMAAALAVLAADLSGLSKAEVERIWLPFAVWFAAGAALLPPRRRRAWLAAQAATALLVNHLLLTTW